MNTTRAETWPSGRDAVASVTVSGWYTLAVCAAANQAWNWVNGEGERSASSSVPWVYWMALLGSVEPPVGAKMSLEGLEGEAVGLAGSDMLQGF